MTRLHRYLFFQFLSAVAFACLAITIVVWFSQAIRMMSLVINNGGSLMSFLALMVLLLPTFMPLLLPVSLAVGVMFVFHRLITESELVVMRAAGMSPMDITKPALALAAMIAGLGYFLTVIVAPVANHEFVRLQYEIRSDLSMLMLHTGSFNDVSKGLTFYARDRGSNGDLRGILIHDTRKAGHPTTIMANSGELVHAPEGPRILVHHGMRQEIDSATGQLSQLSFEGYMVDLSSIGGSFDQRWIEPRERSMLQLIAKPTNQPDTANRQRFLSEFHMRLTLPFLAFTFTLVVCVVALTGNFDRRGMLLRVIIGALAISAIEAGLLTAVNLMAKQGWMVVVLYAVVFAPVPFLYQRLMQDGLRRPTQEVPA
ncbi:MAG TPA: LptF/LptG family permease [Alphaproteobacteria bacterium]|nr:LptF/LptG family permease [Alphaproteobacteria bacterium]